MSEEISEKEVIESLKKFGGHPRFAEIIVELAKTHGQKSSDYDETPLSSLKGTQKWGIRPWESALVLMNTKWQRLSNLLASGKRLEFKKVIELSNDLAVYTILFRILYEEDEEWITGRRGD